MPGYMVNTIYKDSQWWIYIFIEYHRAIKTYLKSFDLFDTTEVSLNTLKQNSLKGAGIKCTLRVVCRVALQRTPLIRRQTTNSRPPNGQQLLDDVKAVLFV